MFHAKFQNHSPSGSGDFGHVTLTIYSLYKLSFPFSKNAPHKGQAVSERRFFSIMVIYMYIAMGEGPDNPLGTKFFQNHKFSVNLPISCKFCPSNHILTIFPIQMHGRPMLTLP